MSATWLARKLTVVAGLAWLVATIVFLALHMVPGDPAELLLSTGGVSPDPASVAELREKLGPADVADEPITIRRTDDPRLEARDALVNLGWSLLDAEHALTTVDASLPVEEQVREALRAAA